MKIQRKIKKLIIVPVVIVNSIIASGAIVEANDLSRGYSQTCRDLFYEESTGELFAKCRRIDGRYEESSINLNRYIANLDGNLVWAMRGNYSRSVEECNIANSADRRFTYLICDEIESSIVLDEHIENVNGQLEYYQ